MDKVSRAQLRALWRLARNFDRNPALKALICRNHGVPLPEPLDGVVARFLGGPGVNYFWPPAGPAAGGGASVASAVRDAFRHPPAGGEVEGAFAGLRYLSGLLAVARKHGMLPAAGEPLPAAAAAAMAEQQEQQGQQDQQEQQEQRQQDVQQQQAAGRGEPGGAAAGGRPGEPRAGAVLVAHPCIAGNIFSRSVVLLCRHDPSAEGAGSYGLILNKPLGSNLRHLHVRLRQLGGGGPSGGALGGGALAPGPGGMLFGGPGGVWQASGGPDTDPADAMRVVGLMAAAAGELPPKQLQSLVDFLAGQQAAAGAAAASAAAPTPAAPRSPEYDEYGNWMGAAAAEAEDDQGAFESLDYDSDELSDNDSDLGEIWEDVTDSDGEEGSEEEDRQPPIDLLLQAMHSTLRNSRGEFENEWGLVPDESPDQGVVESLRAVLRHLGGGSIIVVDPEARVWTHHLPTDDAEDAEYVGGVESYATDEPEGVAQTVLACLSPQDRLLLAHSEAADLREQLLSEQGQAGGAGGEALVAGASSSGSSGRGGLASGGAAAKAQQLMARVDLLLAQGAPPKTMQQQQEQQAAQATAAQHWSAPWGAAGSASSLFGTGGAPSSAAGGGSGSGNAEGPASAGAGGGPTVTQLMGLFGESPLYRGGPVPGVQILHQRPRLGGHLVLPPWGTSPGPQQTAEEVRAAAAAAADAAPAEQPCLEGSLVVGGDLTRALDLLEEGRLQPGDLRICMGDSGWVAGQLEAEVARGTWAVVHTTPAALDLFGAEEAPGVPDSAASEEAARAYETRLWSECLSALGPAHAALAQVPKGVWEDLAEVEV